MEIFTTIVTTFIHVYKFANMSQNIQVQLIKIQY